MSDAFAPSVLSHVKSLRSTERLQRPGSVITAINLLPKPHRNAIKAIAANCPALVSLKIRFARGLTDEAFVAIAANCPSLTTTLTVNDSYLLTDETLKAIAANCPALTSLKAAANYHFTGQAFKTIATNC